MPASLEQLLFLGQDYGWTEQDIQAFAEREQAAAIAATASVGAPPPIFALPTDQDQNARSQQRAQQIEQGEPSMPLEFPSLLDVIFPTGAPVGWPDVVEAGLDLATAVVSGGEIGPLGFQEQLPATIPSAGTLQVGPVYPCPPGMKLRKTQVRPRLSPVSQCVSKRHMNYANPRALRRSITRMRGFFGLVKSAEKAVKQSLVPMLPKRSRGAIGTVKGGRCVSCRQIASRCAC